MKRKHKRLTFVFCGALLVAMAAALVLTAFEDNIVFFYSPTEMKAKAPAPDKRLRLGGLVEEGSLARRPDGSVTFRVTDLTDVIAVAYTGLLPDLFREGQGVVAEGHLKGGTFVADEVLAKHDENYMPPEVAEALMKSGQWKKSEGPNPGSGQVDRKTAR